MSNENAQFHPGSKRPMDHLQKDPQAAYVASPVDQGQKPVTGKGTSEPGGKVAPKPGTVPPNQKPSGKKVR